MTNLEKLQKIASFRIDMSVDVKFDNGDIEHHEYETIRDLFPEYFAEIETALKELEELKTQFAVNSMKDFFRTLDETKKLKALDIIKKKLVCLKAIHLNGKVEEYNTFVDLTNSSPYYLTKEEYELLKEILK